MCPYTAKQTLPPAAQVEVEVGVEAVGPTICTGSLRLLVSSPLAISLSTECTWPRISVQLAERPWTYGMVSHKKKKPLVGPCICPLRTSCCQRLQF